MLVLYSSSEIGGAERSLTRMVRASDGLGIHYQLASIGPEGAWSEWARTCGLQPRCFGAIGGTRARIGAVIRYLSELRRGPPDVIYAVGLKAAALARLAKVCMPGIKVVHAIRSTFPSGTSLARRFSFSERILGRVTSAYVANSGQGATDIQRVAGVARGRVVVIGNGVEEKPAVPPARDRKLQIAVVANINEYKGHLEFLDVVESVRACVPTVSVVFVGRNDLGETLEKEIWRRGLRDVVTLTGYRPDPELYVRESRVLALPSPKIEGSPTSVLEALSIGVPVVAYRVGGLGEIVEDGVTGRLIEPGDHAAMARALTQLLLDEGTNDAFGGAARRSILNRFSLRACAVAHEKVWRTVVAGRALM